MPAMTTTGINPTPGMAAAEVPATMEALVVLEPNRIEIQQVPVPQPGPGQVLARVRAVSICGTDAHLVRRVLPGLLAAPLSRSSPVTSGPATSWPLGLAPAAYGLAGRRPRGRHLA